MVCAKLFCCCRVYQRFSHWIFKSIFILFAPFFEIPFRITCSERGDGDEGYDVTNRIRLFSHPFRFFAQSFFPLFIPDTQSSENMKISFDCVTFVWCSVGVVIGAFLVSDNVRFPFDYKIANSILISQYISIKASYSNFFHSTPHERVSLALLPPPPFHFLETWAQ